MPKTTPTDHFDPVLSKPFQQTVHIVQHKRKAMIAVLGMYYINLRACSGCRKPFLSFDEASNVCLDCAQDLPTQPIDEVEVVAVTRNAEQKNQDAAFGE